MYNVGPAGEMLLGTPELSERLMRALALKGDLPQYLIPQYLATIQQEDLSALEFSWLRRTARFHVGGTAPAVAAEFPIFAFGGQNVQSRNTIATIDMIALSNTTAAGVLVSVAPASLAGTGGTALTRFGNNMDDRQFRNVQSAYAAGVGSNALDPNVAQAMQFVIPAGSTLFLPPEAVGILTDADNGIFSSCMMIAGVVVNTTFRVGLIWRERQLADSEIA